MSKYQAHMALAAASQKHLKHHLSFSPPSQIISNYASFGPATSNPFWHHGLNNHNSQFQLYHDSQKFHHHVHKLPEPKPQQQLLPNVHPSVITPFLEQVQLKQKEAASAAEQKNTYKQSHEGSSQENNGSFEIINDVFSKHLVPPPPSTSYKLKPDKHEKVNKYNLSMPSPLQDASRFNYNNVISTPATPAPIENYRFRPSASDNTFVSTEKPNVFIQLNNRTKENVYKQHKLLHPSYTGGPKKRPAVTIEKPFLPTPYRPGNEDGGHFQDNHELHHSFFTIEDAVTPHLSYQVVKSHIPVDEAPDSIVYSYPQKTNFEHSTSTASPATTISSIEKSTHKPRQKLRRRKPKPQQQPHKEKPVEVIEQVPEQVNAKPNRVRGSIKNVDTQTTADQNNLKTRNRVNHPNRVRSRLNFSSPAATLSTVDYDSTVKLSTEEEQRHEISTVQHVTTEPSTILKSSESSEQPENVKRRVRLRYRNKLRANTNSLEAADFKQRLADNHISDTENDNVVVIKQSYETTESSIATDSGFNEIRSSLKLPNLKLRNEALTTLPTSSDVTSTSVQPSSTLPIEPDENNILSKIINRPRFSIKEYKKKQLSTSSIASTTMTTTTTSATTTKPDSQRFNRLRVNFNRRRNETGSAEETEVSRRRPSPTRSSSTTESSIQTTAYPKRGSLPKRTFATRNFTRPSLNVNDSETTTTSVKPVIKSSTSFNSNRPSTPNLRSRIQSYKAKESTSESTDLSQNTIRNVNISAEVPVVIQEHYATTSTESPYKHETSIMKIAKTPSSVSSEKTTTNNYLDDTTSRNEFDLTGSPSEYSQRVAELTISGNENYSFKSANIGPLSRRIPNYFTISTDDPILPIQAFFPQIKTNEDVSFTN